ncbi:MAG TPA: zf-HC2 domain-containing protein [Candidatus Acidoferrum sp.]|nr:zf-HC2 domain-containing protein [Candidatus Acidoferrum sp.]
MGRVTCRQFIEDYLADYLDASLGPEVAADLERHLEICPPCVAYMNTYKKTRHLVGREAAPDMPEEMKIILRTVLLKHLAKEN